MQLAEGAARIIYVGGGVRIEDEAAKTLAQFTPRVTGDALGDTARARIAFSLPKTYFPKRRRRVGLDRAGGRAG